MKAAIVPSPNGTWQIQETKTPEPGENQVLIKIHASGMCYTDVHQTRGYSRDVSQPNTTFRAQPQLIVSGGMSPRKKRLPFSRGPHPKRKLV